MNLPGEFTADSIPVKVMSSSDPIKYNSIVVTVETVVKRLPLDGSEIIIYQAEQI